MPETNAGAAEPAPIFSSYAPRNLAPRRPVFAVDLQPDFVAPRPRRGSIVLNERDQGRRREVVGLGGAARRARARRGR